MSDSPNRASLRRKCEVAFSHRRAANEVLDSIADTQAKWNAAIAQLDADADGSLDTDYEDNHAISDLFEADDEQAGAQHKAILRKSLRSALSHRRLADEICDSIEEMQAAHNALMAKLDAEGGTLDDGDYEDSLALDVIDSDAEGEDAQHKASLRKSMRSAMRNKRAADQIMDALSEMQEQFNAALAQLDAGSINGAMAGFAVSELDPDAE